MKKYSWINQIEFNTGFCDGVNNSLHESKYIPLPMYYKFGFDIGSQLQNKPENDKELSEICQKEWNKFIKSKGNYHV